MITFILPVYNEEQYIKTTIESILNQTYVGNIEILVADGMSDDLTKSIIHDYMKIYPNIYLIENHEKIVSTGFNRALSVSKGEIIIRVDGHSKIDSKFVENCLLAFKRTNSECVGGPTTHKADNFVGKAITVAQTSKFGVGGVPFREGVKNGKYVDTLAFGAYKREIFSDVGGYDEELVRNQDDEFNFRLIQKNGKIWIDPSIQSTYYPRNSLTSLFKQYFQYGFYKVRVIQKRKSLLSWRHLIPALFLISLFLSFGYLKFFNNELPIIVIIGSYLTLNIVYTFFDLIKSPSSKFIILPFIFITIHISYGFGFLLGLIKFWRKWRDFKLKDFCFDRVQFRFNSNN